MTFKDKLHRIQDGMKVRFHRVVFQLLFTGLLIYFFGWIALLLALLILACELPTWGKLDNLNPWCKQYKQKFEQEEREELKQQVTDLVGKIFPGSRAVEVNDEDDLKVFDDCPHCGRAYDHEDWVEQKCSICNHDAKPLL